MGVRLLAHKEQKRMESAKGKVKKIWICIFCKFVILIYKIKSLLYTISIYLSYVPIFHCCLENIWFCKGKYH